MSVIDTPAVTHYQRLYFIDQQEVIFCNSKKKEVINRRLQVVFFAVKFQFSGIKQ